MHVRFIPLLLTLLAAAMLGGQVSAQAAPPSRDAQKPLFRQITMATATDGWAVVTVPDPDPGWVPAFDSSAFPNQDIGNYLGTLAYVVRTQDGGHTWANVSPPLTYTLISCACADNGFAGAFFLDADHAWAAAYGNWMVGDKYVLGFKFWRTVDGGNSWQTLPAVLATRSISLLQFADETQGWLIGQSYVENRPGDLYRTTDGGATWQLIADDGGATPRETDNPPISQPDTGINRGYYSDTTGMSIDGGLEGWLTWQSFDPPDSGLLHTVDGGETWMDDILLDSWPPPQQAFTDCRFSQPNVRSLTAVTFVADCDYLVRASKTRGAFIYETDDLGKTWEGTLLPGHAADASWTVNPQVAMISATMRWLVVCARTDDQTSCDDASAQLNVYQTNDNAETWQAMSPLPESFKPVLILSGDPIFDFVDEQTAWAPDASGSLLTTSDAGKTWTMLKPVVVIPN